MRKLLTEYIQKEQLITSKESVLLAVSGGVDSMVLLHLFQKLNAFPFAVAHCNFKLRGNDSDLDEKFIINYCKDNNIELFVKSFETADHAQLHGISIQMAARDLRYTWFEELSNIHNYTKIALAQHLDDQTETFFINLMRGTGISGIHGIKQINGKLIRPLLFADRKAIETYQLKNDIPFREDKSNASDKYTRNYIRHHILPKFEKLTSSFSQKLDSNIKNFREVEDFYKYTINKNLAQIVITNKNDQIIEIKELLALDFVELHLRELLIDFSFSTDTINKVYLQLKNPKSGKFFESNTHRVSINRNQLIIRKKNSSTNEEFHLSSSESILSPIHLTSEIIDNNLNSYITSANIALLDFDKLTFPLTLRKWNHADYFHPFGMNGKKKLSDFFTDKKFSKFQKEDIWLLTSADNIIWIIGYRTDNRYRITKKTTRILKITLKDGIN